MLPGCGRTGKRARRHSHCRHGRRPQPLARNVAICSPPTKSTASFARNKGREVRFPRWEVIELARRRRASFGSGRLIRKLATSAMTAWSRTCRLLWQITRLIRLDRSLNLPAVSWRLCRQARVGSLFPAASLRACSQLLTIMVARLEAGTSISARNHSQGS
jgi:hypothetical protein